MAALINEHDWSAHPLGPIASWPLALRQFISTMLASRFPMYLAWGSEGYSFYNDGYIPILTDKHPGALGATFERVWGELTPEIRALIDSTRDDRTAYFEDMPLQLLKNGRLEQCYFTFSYSGVRGDTGQIEGFYAVCLETTQAYYLKQQRVSESERLKALFQQAPGFMAVTRGPEHVIEIANDAYHALVGHARELLGKTVRVAIPEAESQGFIALLDQVYDTGEPFIGRESRFDVVREVGQAPVEIYVDFVYQPIFAADNQVNGIMVQGHEVTQAYCARQALVVADRQKDQFIATLAHELRNPLSPIRAASHLLQLPNARADYIEQAAGVISRQVDHMAKLLDDLLDVARISRNQVRLAKQAVSVDTIIAAAIETAKPSIDRKHQQISFEQTAPVELDGDVVRLTQAISNLVCNASKYTDAGGAITVSVTREGPRCRIAVKDNGVGIQSDALASVFDMFSQQTDVLDRSEGGLGIGLGLVKGLIDLHGGTVSAHSDGRGSGSTFTVELPCREGTATVAQPVQAAPDAASATGLKILIADDNVDLVDLFASFLALMGHQVLTANDGLTAFALAAEELPAVAILDIGMPGMNGYELARAIRQQAWSQDMKLVAATGWGNAEDQDKTQSAGFDLHLTKPFTLDELKEAIGRLGPAR